MIVETDIRPGLEGESLVFGILFISTDEVAERSLHVRAERNLSRESRLELNRAEIKGVCGARRLFSERRRLIPSLPDRNDRFAPHFLGGGDVLRGNVRPLRNEADIQGKFLRLKETRCSENNRKNRHYDFLSMFFHTRK